MKATTRHNLLIAGIFVASIVLIVLFQPREKALHYEFTIGKPWKYEQLIATFDFPVQKSMHAIEKERADILAKQRPYYLKDTQTGINVIDSFDVYYKKELHLMFSASLQQRIRRKLQEVYNNGIISSTDLRKLNEDSITSIMCVEQNRGIATAVDKLYTVQEAYEQVMSIDTARSIRHALQNGNLNDFIVPNLVYDARRSAAVVDEALANISSNSGVILAGQKIIGSGEMIDEDNYQILESYRKEVVKRIDVRGIKMTVSGQILLVTILIGCFALYLFNYRRSYLQSYKKLLFLLTQLVIFPIIASFIANDAHRLMIIPFALAPIMIGVFLDTRTAFMGHLIIVLISSVVAPNPYVFILLQLTAGLFALYSLAEFTERSQLFRTTGIVFLCYTCVFFGYELITHNSWAAFDRQMYISFIINGVLLLFAYPLMFLFEKIFSFTSNVTLIELSNINGKLLRILSENTPGTFQHSMQVGNLAAAAANKVGANSQLVRTGALYHDIGKLENPVFFTENQGSTNPHACLDYEQSAKIIIGHVHAGLKLADKYHLPESIKAFIATHHGRSKAKYFYISYKNEHPDEEVDEELFTYPGPNPYTLETAILMMSDSVEAASRSLPEYTEESIGNLVDRIIDSQVAEGYFTDCPITFKDIRDIKAVFKEKLRTIYHTRISYPELKK